MAAPVAVGEKVSWPAIQLLDGPVWSSEQMGSRATVVVFFATDCPFCRRHNAHLDKLVRGLKGRPLRVLAVAQDRDPETVRSYISQQGYSFPVSLDVTPLRALLSQRKVIPLTCVVDRTGVLREVIPGEMFEDDVLEFVKWA